MTLLLLQMLGGVALVDVKRLKELPPQAQPPPPRFKLPPIRVPKDNLSFFPSFWWTLFSTPESFLSPRR